VLVSERAQVLTTAQSDLWADVLDEIGGYDTYHLPAYHRLAEIRGEGEAALFVFRAHDCTIAFPMLIRDVNLPVCAGSQGLRDVTSVYGYPGPVASTREIGRDTKERFALCLEDFLRSERVICAFSRLNPIIDNAYILGGLGEAVDVGPTTSIDLTVPRAVQYARYRRSHKHDVQRLVEKGFTCREAGKEALDGFLRVYHETMVRNNAEPYYYFDRTYFEYMLDEMPEVAHLFVCRDGATIVSGMIAFACNGIVQGHVGGSLNDHVRLAPMKLVYDTVRMWANDIGAHIFHMGGGVAGRRDSLFQHKQGFGRQEHVFSVWRCVVEPRVCEELHAEMCRMTGVVPEDGFFPPYRHPAFANGHRHEP
jgi:hypothetical protein